MGFCAADVTLGLPRLGTVEPLSILLADDGTTSAAERTMEAGVVTSAEGAATSEALVEAGVVSGSSSTGSLATRPSRLLQVHYKEKIRTC